MDTGLAGVSGSQGAEACRPGRNAAAAVSSAPCCPRGRQGDMWLLLGGDDVTDSTM